MLVEDSARPLGPGEQKHVIAVGRRPIRHRHPGSMARDQATDANQKEGGNRRDYGKNGQRWIVLGSPHSAILSAINKNRCGSSTAADPFKPDILLCVEREIRLFGSRRRNFHFHRLLPSFPVVHFDRIFAGRQVLNLERPVLPAHRVERMAHHRNVGEHPGMHIAFESQKGL